MERARPRKIIARSGPTEAEEHCGRTKFDKYGKDDHHISDRRHRRSIPPFSMN